MPREYSGRYGKYNDHEGTQDRAGTDRFLPEGSTDLLDEYQKRHDIMQEYAPKLLSKEEVVAIVQEKFADVIATKNKGQIMKTIMPELKGKADGKVINEVVTELCNA